MEGNTKLQASFRRYNPNIPPYLRERPHHILKHCLEKHALAESMRSSYVEVIDVANGVFAVRSQSDTDNKRNYRVQFNQPSCECYNWERQRMPGKHFFAVFLHVPAWSFERLPIPYRDSLSLPLKMTYSGLGQVTWRKATELTKKRLTRCQAELNNTLNFLRFPLLQKQCNSRIFRAKLPGREQVLQKMS